MTSRCYDVTCEAEAVADALWHEQIGTRHMLIALLNHCEGPAAEAMQAAGIDGPALAEKLMQVDASW